MERPPSPRELLWLLARWSPSVFLITCLTGWSLCLFGGLARVTGWLFMTQLFPFVGLLGLVLAVAYAVLRKRLSKPTAAAIGLSLLLAYPLAWRQPAFAAITPAFPGPEGPRIAVRLPSNRPLRVAWGGDVVSKNYHAFFPDQRYAYDLTIDPSGHQKPQLQDYGCFGTEVVAPARATVVVAHDGEEDLPPRAAEDRQRTPFGNHIVLQLPETKTYLVLAHLREKSIRVQVGVGVEEGQPIAECGNSGRTSEPHIHIHHQRQDPREFGNFAEGLPLEFRGHQGPPVPEGGWRLDENKKIEWTGVEIQHVATSSAPANMP